MINHDNTQKCEQLKQMLNRIYGRALQATLQLYVDTDSILDIDCGFCRNANTCVELSHDNDLSYKSCGFTGEGVRMMFRSGGNLKTQLQVEMMGKVEMELIGVLNPNYCPFCGRPLFENMKQKENKNV